MSWDMERTWPAQSHTVRKERSQGGKSQSPGCGPHGHPAGAALAGFWNIDPAPAAGQRGDLRARAGLSSDLAM